MPGTLTTTYTSGSGFIKASMDWTSDSGGDVNGTTIELNGFLRRVVFVPDSAGTQPTNLYDITLDDADGIDVLSGQGANLSNSAASQIAPGCPLKDGTTTSTTAPLLVGTVELKVSNAGDSKGGTVILYIE